MNFLILLALSATALAGVKTEVSGNLELQGRGSWNNSTARKEYLQTWQKDEIFLGYGNINGKVTGDESTVETNVFARHSRTDLYQGGPRGDDFAVVRVLNFPETLVARDLFKLRHFNQTSHSRDEIVLNKLYYQWDGGDARALAGRFYINYGLGEIFNPINPFNQPTALTTTGQVAQGNDGAGLSLFPSEGHRVDFYLLGDKRFHDNEGKIQRTLWVRGEYQLSPDLTVDYVLGEDQDRHKAGGQVSLQLEGNLLFLQTLYQTEFLSNEESNNLLDVLLGFDRQLSPDWHLRLESGYQKINRFLSGRPERFLPTEYFLALANQYDFHPLLQGSLTFINDIKSGFTYGVVKISWSLFDNAEAEAFAFTPVARGGSASNATQELVTVDAGLAVRAFF